MKYLSAFDPAKCGGHERRYALSVEWIEPMLAAGQVVYDLGWGDWPFATMIRNSFPAEIRSTGDADLRYRFPVEDAAADGVTCMEVIEHMKDRQEDDPATFTYSGIRALLSECHRILKPGGWLFLSTPNLSCYGCIWSHIKGESPQWYLPHVRELGVNEVRRYVGEAGFSIDRLFGVDVWPDQECPIEIRGMVDRIAPNVPRQSCLFMLLRKR